MLKSIPESPRVGHPSDSGLNTRNLMLNLVRKRSSAADGGTLRTTSTNRRLLKLPGLRWGCLMNTVVGKASPTRTSRFSAHITLFSYRSRSVMHLTKLSCRHIPEEVDVAPRQKWIEQDEGLIVFRWCGEPECEQEYQEIITAWEGMLESEKLRQADSV